MISYGTIYGGFHLNLSHLPNLSIFNFNLQTFFGYILKALDSLPNPQKLTHITVSPCNAFDKDTKSNLLLPETLKHFLSLHSLHLTIFSFTFTSELLKSFTNPSNLSLLILHTKIQTPKQLRKLGYLIRSLYNLTVLSVSNQNSVEGDAKNAHRKFFEKISGLGQLKILRVFLCHQLKMPDDKTYHECLTHFVNCLKNMHELQEIEFLQSEFCTEEELKSLADALEKKGSKLKKLKIKFINKNRERDHLEKLSKAIRAMKNLEKLKLEGLYVTKASIEEFGKAISDLKSLKSLAIEVRGKKIDQTTLTKIAREILMKYGLRKLKWYGEKIVEETKEEACIDIKEVIMRNPHLYKITWGDYKEHQFIVFKNVKGFLRPIKERVW